jgi:tRNA threonylcarbamoyladenosine biosynthesis protein TsaE
LLGAGIDEYLYSGGVAVMEWADRWPEILPDEALRVELVILDEHSRSITLSGLHGRSASVIEALRKTWRT